jgi:hypothetical protein
MPVVHIWIAPFSFLCSMKSSNIFSLSFIELLNGSSFYYHLYVIIISSSSLGASETPLLLAHTGLRCSPDAGVKRSQSQCEAVKCANHFNGESIQFSGTSVLLNTGPDLAFEFTSLVDDAFACSHEMRWVHTILHEGIRQSGNTTYDSR